MIFRKNTFKYTKKQIKGTVCKDLKIVELILIFKKVLQQSYLVLAGPCHPFPFNLPRDRRASFYSFAK